MSWNCAECYDTETIDRGGAEIPCPYCQPVTVRITGLGHRLGENGHEFATATAYTASTITFVGTRSAILADVDGVARIAARQAKRDGKPRAAAWAGAIAGRVRAELG